MTMEKKIKNIRNFVVISIFIFFITLILSIVFYPLQLALNDYFSWLSNFGDFFLNPYGAYSLRCGLLVSGGILIYVFWKTSKSLIKISGIIFGFFLLILGIFSIFSFIISFWFISSSCIFLINISVFKKNNFLALLGFFIVALNLIYVIVFYNPFLNPLLELVNFIFNLGFILNF